MIRLIFLIFIFSIITTYLKAGVIEVCNLGPGIFPVKKHKTINFSDETSISKSYTNCKVHFQKDNKELYNAILNNLRESINRSESDFTHKILDKTYLEILAGNYQYNEPGLKQIKGPSKKTIKTAKQLYVSLNSNSNQALGIQNEENQVQMKIKIKGKKKILNFF